MYPNYPEEGYIPMQSPYSTQSTQKRPDWSDNPIGLLHVRQILRDGIHKVIEAE